MGTQASSENWIDRISLGGGQVSICTTPITSMSSLPSVWENIGFIDEEDSIALDLTREMITYSGGTPSHILKEVVKSTNSTVQFNVCEFDFANLAIALNSTPSYTNGSYSSTIKTTPTPLATVFSVTSATGLTENALMEITMGSAKEYKYCKDLSTLVVTPHSALSAAPAAGAAIKNVTSIDLAVGAESSLTEYALKITKTLTGLNDTLTVYFYKVTTSGNFSLNLQDGTKNKVPFNFRALSTAAVESGGLFTFRFAM